MPEPTVVHEADVAAEHWSDAVRGVLSFRTLGVAQATGLSAGTAVIGPGGWLGLHRHAPAETYYVLEGEGLLTLEGQEHALTPGVVVHVPGGAEHGVRQLGSAELRFFYVFAAGSFDDVEYAFRADRDGAR